MLSVHVKNRFKRARRWAAWCARGRWRGSRPRTDRALCWVYCALCMACCVLQYARKSIGIIKGRVLPRKTAAPLFFFSSSRVAALFYFWDPMQRQPDRGSVQRCEIVKRFSLGGDGFGFSGFIRSRLCRSSGKIKSRFLWVFG